MTKRLPNVLFVMLTTGLFLLGVGKFFDCASNLIVSSIISTSEDFTSKLLCYAEYAFGGIAVFCSGIVVISFVMHKNASSTSRALSAALLAAALSLLPRALAFLLRVFSFEQNPDSDVGLLVAIIIAFVAATYILTVLLGIFASTLPLRSEGSPTGRGLKTAVTICAILLIVATFCSIGAFVFYGTTMLNAALPKSGSVSEILVLVFSGEAAYGIVTAVALLTVAILSIIKMSRKKHDIQTKLMSVFVYYLAVMLISSVIELLTAIAATLNGGLSGSLELIDLLANLIPFFYKGILTGINFSVILTPLLLLLGLLSAKAFKKSLKATAPLQGDICKDF